MTKQGLTQIQLTIGDIIDRLEWRCITPSQEDAHISHYHKEPSGINPTNHYKIGVPSSIPPKSTSAAGARIGERCCSKLAKLVKAKLVQSSKK